MVKKNFRVIDLYSGCGGFSLGFQMAGFHVVLGVDNDEAALTTFVKNHKNSHTLCLDLERSDAIDQIVSFVDNESIDVIIAGPPCQGFSVTGTRDENDKRNRLFYAVFRLADRIGPKAVVIENVPGFATLYGGKAREAVLAEFTRHSLLPNESVLFAPDFGVPQIRRRVFFVGLQKQFGTFRFPTPVVTPENYVSCSDAISDLPSREFEPGSEVDVFDKPPATEYQNLMRKESQVLFNHVATRHTHHVIDVISQVPEGGNHKDLPPGVGTSRRFNEAWTRYHGSKPSKTIDTGHRNHFHYKYNRVPTIRENARLQSFPDDFVFCGTRTQQNRQVGNAVPPLLGYHIGKKLVEHFKSIKDDDTNN